MDLTEPTGPSSPLRWLRFARRVPLAGSVALGVALAVVYVWRPDACAAVTIVPVGAWLVPGLALTVLDLRSRRGWVVVAAWVVFLIALAEEPRSLGRGLIRSGTLAPGTMSPPVGAIRVVSLNCAIGTVPAADEVAAYHPDIVLLQESPGRARGRTPRAELVR